jgi:hypothetical protein
MRPVHHGFGRNGGPDIFLGHRSRCSESPEATRESARLALSRGWSRKQLPLTGIDHGLGHFRVKPMNNQIARIAREQVHFEPTRRVRRSRITGKLIAQEPPRPSDDRRPTARWGCGPLIGRWLQSACRLRRRRRPRQARDPATLGDERRPLPATCWGAFAFRGFPIFAPDLKAGPRGGFILSHGPARATQCPQNDRRSSTGILFDQVIA